MSRRRSIEARAVHIDRRRADRERTLERRQARCRKHFHGDARYSPQGRVRHA